MNNGDSIRQQDADSAHGKRVGINMWKLTEGVTMWQRMTPSNDYWDQVLLVRETASPEGNKASAWAARTEESWTAWTRFEVDERGPVGFLDGNTIKVRDFSNTDAKITLRGFSIEPPTIAEAPDGTDFLIHSNMVDWFPDGRLKTEVCDWDPSQSLLKLVNDKARNEARNQASLAIAHAPRWRLGGWRYLHKPGRPKPESHGGLSDAERARILVATFRELGRPEWAKAFSKRTDTAVGKHQAEVDRLVRRGLIQSGGQPYELTLDARIELYEWD